MESGGGSNNQDDRGGRIPPDEQQMRLGRARIAQGLTPGDESIVPGGARGENDFAAVGAPSSSPFMAGSRAAAAGTGAGDALDPGSRFRPWSEGAPTAQGPVRCEFLRSVGPDGRLAEAQKTAVPTHRCAAFGDPLPLSLRQQELVCLQRVHISCPRYVRGTLLATEDQAKPESAEQRRRIPTLMVAGVVLFVLALGILFTGLLGLPPFGGGGSPTRQPIAAASVALSPTPAATRTAAVTPTIGHSPAAVASASPVATASPTPAPTATPAASATWPPGATASRMDLLVPCTGQPNCYVYTVRSAAQNGSSVADTVDGIARFFGVSTSSIYALNPWATAGVSPGDKLKIPPPTR